MPSRSLFWLRKFFAAGQEIISAIKEMFFHILRLFKREKKTHLANICDTDKHVNSTEWIYKTKEELKFPAFRKIKD